MKKPDLPTYITYMRVKGFEPNYSRLQYNFISSGIFGIAVPDVSLKCWLQAGGELPKSVMEKLKKSKPIDLRVMWK